METVRPAAAGSEGVAGMRVAVIGGGQLGRMLGMAGIPLGMAFRFLDPAADCPAAAVGELVRGAYDDPASLATLIAGADLVTYEFENVPADAAAYVEERSSLAPSSRSLAVAQDRIAEKDFFRACGVKVQPYATITSIDDLREAVSRVGTPAMLKTRRLGYDGKGQVLIRSEAGAGPAWESLGCVPCIYEAYVTFERELSIVATRAASGAFVAHPAIRNEHRAGILRVSVCPDPDMPPWLAREAQANVRAIAEALGHVGTLAVEFFVTKDGLVANEMAPRVHNSGHWTIEGAQTSQFENHLRAIAGLPLGDGSVRGAAAMLNLIGVVPPVTDFLRVPGCRVHLYGKTPKPGRKLGHLTVTAADGDELTPKLERLRSIIGLE